MAQPTQRPYNQAQMCFVPAQHNFRVIKQS